MYRTAIPENDVIEEPRYVHFERNPPSTAIGVGIIGGNNIGIFISDIQKNSLAGQSELKAGDQILLVSAIYIKKLGCFICKKGSCINLKI